MSLAYRAVGWNRQKRLYDFAIGSALLSGLAVYGIAVSLYQPGTTVETFIIRFSSIAAIILLHVILAIGPLARLDRRFLPLLYNRRHLGVTMFLLALIHGAFAIIQFHAGGDLNPLVSVLTSYRRDYLSFLSGPDQIAHFPFEALGLPEFYIGWQSKSPTHLGRHCRNLFAVVLAVTLALFFLAARFQNPIDPGAFEFGVERTFEGILIESPLPALQVRGPQTRSGMTFLLVGAGKFGAADVVHGKNDQHIRFIGSLIHRNGVAMIELNKPDSLEVVDNTREDPPQMVSLGGSKFVGELVDTKCFLGVMRPATGKVHRGCAVRCLSGGAPPALLVRDEQGNDVALLLASLDDKAPNIGQELAARLLEVEGDLELHAGIPVLRVRSWRLAE